MIVKVKEKFCVRFIVKKFEFDKYFGEIIKLGIVEGFVLFVYVNDVGNYIFIVKGRNGEEFVIGGFVVG